MSVVPSGLQYTLGRRGARINETGNRLHTLSILRGTAALPPAAWWKLKQTDYPVILQNGTV